MSYTGPVETTGTVMAFSSLRLLGAVALVASTAGCAPLLPCDAADRRYAAQLLFGRAIGTQGEVSDDDWQDFLAATVTPAFPDGLTVSDAQGQWKDAATGSIVRERSKVVMVLVDDPAVARTRLEAVTGAYKQRFRQDAVGIVIAPACVSVR